jgi:hypothetical protein
MTSPDLMPARLPRPAVKMIRFKADRGFASATVA